MGEMWKSTPAGKRVGTYKTKELDQAGVFYPLPKRAFVPLGDAEAFADGLIDQMDTRDTEIWAW